jgi:hypothetical protein
MDIVEALRSIGCDREAGVVLASVTGKKQRLLPRAPVFEQNQAHIPVVRTCSPCPSQRAAKPSAKNGQMLRPTRTQRK